MIIEKLLLVLTGVVILGSFISIRAQQKSEEPGDAGKYDIKNCVNTFSMDKIEETKVGFQYWFVDKELADGKTLKMSVVRPGLSTHAPHSHPEDEFFFILDGKGEFYLNGETVIIEKNTSLYCPPNSEHAIRNIGDSELKYLVIRKYDQQ